MAGWIKMVLGTQIGLSPGDFVLDGDPARCLNFRPIFIIVIVILLEHCTGVIALLVCSSSSFSILYILFLESLIVLSLFRYAQLHHIAPIAEEGVAN